MVEIKLGKSLKEIAHELKVSYTEKASKSQALEELKQLREKIISEYSPKKLLEIERQDLINLQEKRKSLEDWLRENEKNKLLYENSSKGADDRLAFIADSFL